MDLKNQSVVVIFLKQVGREYVSRKSRLKFYNTYRSLMFCSTLIEKYAFKLNKWLWAQIYETSGIQKVEENNSLFKDKNYHAN